MAPPKKRPRVGQCVEPPNLSNLLSDNHAKWLLKGEQQTVEIHVKSETLLVHRNVLTKHSHYFERCLKEPWTESNGVITFDDINPRSLALYIGVAYSHSSMVAMSAPASTPNPQTKADRTPLKDFVEVYKLCDRFVSPVLAEYISSCINTAIGDGHRALFRIPLDDTLQQGLIQDFADGYEALELAHPKQKTMGETMIDYFCEGVSYAAWDTHMEKVADRPRFVGSVSRGFARRLQELKMARRLKRREMTGPS